MNLSNALPLLDLHTIFLINICIHVMFDFKFQSESKMYADILKLF